MRHRAHAPNRHGLGLGLGMQRGEGAHTQLAWAETEAGTAEGRRRSTPGQSALIKLLAA